MTLSDSDVLMDYLNSREPGFSAVKQLLRARLLKTTTITLFEVYTGVRDAEERLHADELFLVMDCEPLSEEAALRAAEINRALARRGDPLPVPDLLIAGIALTLKLPLLTRNRRHFERIPELIVLTP